MYSVHNIGARVIRQNLIAYTDVTDIVGDHIFQDSVPEDVEMPYIVIAHNSGGEDNETRSRAVDYVWRVACVTASRTTKRLISDAIFNALHQQMPITTGLTGVVGYTWIEEIIPIVDVLQKQNVQLYQVGGLYRLRLSIMGE